MNNSQPTMTPAQAAAYAEKILQDTADALTPRPRLETSSAGEPYGILNNTTVCTDGPNADQMVVVSRGYWLRGITVHDYAAVGEQVLAYRKSLHWVITEAHGVGTTQPMVLAVAPPYAFSVSVSWGTGASLGGQLSMGPARCACGRTGPRLRVSEPAAGRQRPPRRPASLSSRPPASAPGTPL